MICSNFPSVDNKLYSALQQELHVAGSSSLARINPVNTKDFTAPCSTICPLTSKQLVSSHNAATLF
jgi:hypothetical protein